MICWLLLKQNQPTKCAVILLICSSFNVFCQEINISSTLDTTGHVYETEIGDNEATKNEVFVINPSLLGSYSSRILSASITASHYKIWTSNAAEDINEGENTRQNYTDFSYRSDLTLIENSLSLILDGAQNHRAINQQQAYFNDGIVGLDNLTKSRSDSVRLNFSIPNPQYFGLTLRSAYSKTQTGQSQEGQTGVDGDNVSLSANLYQGKRIRLVNYDIYVKYNDTSRANFQNFESTLANGSIGFPIVKKVDFIVTGSIEEYDAGQTGFIRNLDSYNYGAGLKWSPSNGRNISLTYNHLEKNENQTDFLGINLVWAFSPRTALNFDYSKQFYGDSYRFAFTQSLKFLRTSVTYSEELTTFSRLGTLNTNTNGGFVCEFGSVELIDCFQPDSLDYQLQPGEEFRASTEIATDISEEVILRKSGIASIGYERRKVSASIDASYQRNEYLESDRLSINRSLGLNLNYAISRRTNISLASKIATTQFDVLETADTMKTTSLNLKRSLSRYLNMNVTARLLDRKSDNFERNGSDKRLSIGIDYTF